MVERTVRPEENDKWNKEATYKSWVGLIENYSLAGAIQFNLLTALGMRQEHYLLDIGCGSFRGGKMSIVYLLPEHYYGIEPVKWVVEEGIRNELGNDLVILKKPIIDYNEDFTATVFNRDFDYILAQSIFSHASKSQIRRCISQVSKVMHKDSMFAFTFSLGNSCYEGEEWVFPQCVKHTLAFIDTVCKENGLICTPIKWPHQGQQWVVATNPACSKIIPNFSGVTWFKEK